MLQQIIIETEKKLKFQLINVLPLLKGFPYTRILFCIFQFIFFSFYRYKLFPYVLNGYTEWKT